MVSSRAMQLVYGRLLSTLVYSFVRTNSFAYFYTANGCENFRKLEAKLLLVEYRFLNQFGLISVSFTSLE